MQKVESQLKKLITDTTKCINDPPEPIQKTNTLLQRILRDNNKENKNIRKYNKKLENISNKNVTTNMKQINGTSVRRDTDFGGRRKIIKY